MSKSYVVTLDATTVNAIWLRLPSASDTFGKMARWVAAPDQAWYWTPEWQAQERQAEADLRAGRYEEFATMDEFLASL